MPLFDEELRDKWVRLVDEQVEEKCVSQALHYLSIVSSDPRLHNRLVTDVQDVQMTAETISRAIEELELHQLELDDPAGLRESFVRFYVETYLKRLGRQDLSPDGLLDFERDGDVSPQPQSSEIRARTESIFDDGPVGDTSSQSAASTVQSPSTEERADEISEGDEAKPGSADELPFHPSDIDLSQLLEGADLGPEMSRVVERGLDTEESEANIEWLVQNRDLLETAIRETDGEERLLALAAFGFLAVDQPEAVEPWIGVIEEVVDSPEDASTEFALFIYLAVALEAPTALVGHMDPVWEELDSLTDRGRAMAFDVAERLSQDAPERLASRTDKIADGLCDETPRVREDASLVLIQIAEERPQAIVAYSGLLTKQLQYEDRTGDLAAVLLSKTADAKPMAVAPFADQVNSELTVEVRVGKLRALLRTLRHLIMADVVDGVPFDEVLECLNHDAEDVRAEALTVCNEMAKREPERVQQEMRRIIRCVDDESETVIQAATLVMSTMAETKAETVEPFVDDVVARLETKGQDDRSAVIELTTLMRVARNRPGTVLPHLETVVSYVDSEDAKQQECASRIVGHISQESASVVESHVDGILQQIRESENEDVLVPLLDAMRHLAEHDPALLQGRLDDIVAQAEHEAPRVAALASETCRIIAETDASALPSQFDRLLSLLQSGPEPVQQNCLEISREVASAEPSRIDERFEWLLERTRNPDDDVTEAMVLALSGIVSERPELINDVPHEWYLRHDDLSLRSAMATVLLVGASEYEGILVDNLELIGELLHSSEWDHQYAALMACRELIEPHPETVADYTETIAEFLNDEDDDLRMEAFDCMERLSRDHDPSVLEPHVDTIVSHRRDSVPEVRRDVARCLGNLGRLDEAQIESEFYHLQELLEDENQVVSAAAVSAIEAIAEQHPRVAQQATEQIVEWIRDDTSSIKIGLRALSRIAGSYPARLKPHVDRVAQGLTADDEVTRTAAIHIFGYVSGTNGDTVVPYLPELRAAAEGLDADFPMIDILSNVAKEDTESAADHVDLAMDILERGDSQEAKGALITAYHVAEESPEVVADHVETIAIQLGSRDEAVAYCSSAVLGELSDDIPEVVEPFSEQLVEYLETTDKDRMRLPALDALYNIAVESPETVEPHLDIVKEIETDDETLQTLKHELVGLYEEVSSDDEDPDSDPDYELGTDVSPTTSYNREKVTDPAKDRKNHDSAHT